DAAAGAAADRAVRVGIRDGSGAKADKASGGIFVMAATTHADGTCCIGAADAAAGEAFEPSRIGPVILCRMTRRDGSRRIALRDRGNAGSHKTSGGRFVASTDARRRVGA